MKTKPEKLDNDIIELLVEQQILMHKTKLEQLFNKEFKFEEIINVDGKVNDFIHTSKKLGVPIHDDIKIYKPFKQIRQEIIETTSPDNSDEIKFADDYTWVKYKNDVIYLKGNQQHVIRLLCESYHKGEPALSWDTIRTTMVNKFEDENQNKKPEKQKTFSPESMFQVFKSNPKAWESLIIRKDKGFYRINLP